MRRIRGNDKLKRLQLKTIRRIWKKMREKGLLSFLRLFAVTMLADVISPELLLLSSSAHVGRIADGYSVESFTSIGDGDEWDEECGAGKSTSCCHDPHRGAAAEVSITTWRNPLISFLFDPPWHHDVKSLTKFSETSWFPITEKKKEEHFRP